MSVKKNKKKITFVGGRHPFNFALVMCEHNFFKWAKCAQHIKLKMCLLKISVIWNHF
jgi:hypothetical protein